MNKGLVGLSILFFILYVAFLVLVNIRYGYPTFLMIYYVSLFFWLLYYLIRFRVVRYGLYLLIAGLGLGVYWLFPNMNPVIRWVVSLGIPGLVIIVNGILLFYQYKKKFPPSLLIEKAEKSEVKKVLNLSALPFLKTFWETFLFILQHWIFFIQYLVLHVIYVLFFTYLIIFYNRFHLLDVIGTPITAILIILWLFALILGFAFVNTLSIRAMKEVIENPGTRSLCRSLKNSSINWVFTFFNFFFILWVSLALLIFFVIPYIIAFPFYFFLPILFAFYPDRVAYPAFMEKMTTVEGRLNFHVIGDSIRMSKGIRIFLLFYVLILFIIPGITVLFYIIGAENPTWMNNLIFSVWLSVYVIFQYTFGTMYAVRYLSKQKTEGPGQSNPSLVLGDAIVLTSKE